MLPLKRISALPRPYPVLHHIFLLRSFASSHDVPPEIMMKLKTQPSSKLSPLLEREPPKESLLPPSTIEGPFSTTYLRPRPNNTMIENDECTLQPPGKAGDRPKKNFVIVCHEMDSQGNVHIHGGKVLKSQLCNNLGLLPRDLRKLDGTLRDQLPVILVRECAILVNIDPLRAVIKHDGVILFEDSRLDSRMQQIDLIQTLQQRLRKASNPKEAVDQGEDEAPFEFIVLETILQKAVNSLQEDFDALQPEIEMTLKALEKIVHWERLKVLLMLKKRVNQFQERVNNFRDCLKELLESDADMSDMYLTEKSESNNMMLERPVGAHEEIELMLESYLKTAEEISSRIQLMASNMQSTEDIVNIALVGQRNELLLLEIRLTIATFAASLSGFGASVFGMNLPNGMEHNPTSFYAVFGTLLTMAGVSGLFMWRRLIRLIKQT